MITPDIINGLFELLGTPFILLSVFKLYKEKQVKGVSWLHAGYFTVWGWWNLYYYPYLSQWASTVGCVLIVIANTVWVTLMIYYLSRNKKG